VRHSKIVVATQQNCHSWSAKKEERAAGVHESVVVKTESPCSSFSLRSSQYYAIDRIIGLEKI
jgi:hypothetical protein